MHAAPLCPCYPGDFFSLTRAKSAAKLCLSGPVLRDTARLSQRYPPIARYGVFGVSTWPIGRDTPSPFSERFPLGEHEKWRCDTPPPQKGYLSDTCAIPHENKANECDTPYCAIWGGISHWAAKNFVSISQTMFGQRLMGSFYMCRLHICMINLSCVILVLECPGRLPCCAGLSILVAN